MSYYIKRFFQNGDAEVIETGLTLEEAQAHCKDPESSSKTATGMDQYTEKRGPWFDGYEEE